MSSSAERPLSALYLWQVKYGMPSEKVVNVLALSVDDAIEKASRADIDCGVQQITQVKRQELYVYFDSDRSATS